MPNEATEAANWKSWSISPNFLPSSTTGNSISVLSSFGAESGDLYFSFNVNASPLSASLLSRVFFW